jgi:uncharacterized NAD(P)/FAD-binding protein YdhS
MRKTIAIVGAGFSGTVLAANLLRLPAARETDIVLIERGPVMGRGIAYAADEFPYLLNVPAARLSADSRDPQQFLRFANARLQSADGEDFLPRALYGDYLQNVLLEAERAAPPHIRLRRVFGEVTDILRTQSAPLAAHFKDRPPIHADSVVLALGNPPPAPQPWAADVLEHDAFRQDPRDLPKNLSEKHSVLIVGNGLTMADVASVLGGDSSRGPMLQTISRRGLLPRPQGIFHTGAVMGGDALLACAQSLRQVLKACRAMVGEIEKLGGDWREAIGHIRSLAPVLWGKLPEIERRRFVRHVQTHWDIHRHRLPPQLATRIEHLRRAGRLHVSAGRIQHIAVMEHRLRVSWRPRGSAESKTLVADLVVNATGPNYSIERSRDPLTSALRTAGLITSDALQLGIRTASYGACLDANGRPAGNLYYLGPMLRADHWDATGAIELRGHAEKLAAHLAGSD